MNDFGLIEEFIIHRARLVILYDNSFKAIFPKAEEKVKQIMKEVGKLYKKFGTSEIEFKLVKIAHVNQDYSWKTFFGMEDSRYVSKFRNIDNKNIISILQCSFKHYHHFF